MAEYKEQIGVGLADAIRQVRMELEKALQEGTDSPIAFQAGPVELDFEVGFTRSGDAGGGLQLSVLSLGVKGQRSSSVTHHVKVAFTPVDRSRNQSTEPDPVDDAGPLLPAVFG